MNLNIHETGLKDVGMTPELKKNSLPDHQGLTSEVKFFVLIQPFSLYVAKFKQFWAVSYFVKRKLIFRFEVYPHPQFFNPRS